MKFAKDWKVALGCSVSMVVLAIIGETVMAAAGGGDARDWFWWGIGELTRFIGIAGSVAFLAIALANYAGTRNKCTTSRENVRLGNSGTTAMVEALITFVVTLLLVLVLGADSKLLVPTLCLGGVVFCTIVLKMTYNRGRCNDGRMIADLRLYERGQLGSDKPSPN